MSRGGYRWGVERTAVERCARIDAKMLREGGLLARDADTGWEFGLFDPVLLVAVSSVAKNAIVLVSIRKGHKGTPQIVRLVWLPCRYGGRRALMLCPRCNRRVFRLYQLPSEDALACRFCNGLTYELLQSARRNKPRQAMKRAERIEKQLRMGNSSVLTKPRGMHWTTFLRLGKKLIDATREVDETLRPIVAKRFPKLAL